jgi:hypothetical protein
MARSPTTYSNGIVAVAVLVQQVANWPDGITYGQAAAAGNFGYQPAGNGVLLWLCLIRGEVINSSTVLQ